MRCSEQCDVNGKRVRCQDEDRPHYAHRWTQMIKPRGRMEIHWRTKPEKRATVSARTHD